MQVEKLSGVTLLYPDFLYGLKSYSLLFDEFYVYGLSSIDYLDVEESLKADVEFLQQKKVLVELPLDVWIEVGKEAHASEDYKKLIATFDNATVNAQNVAWDHDYFTRLASAKMAAKGVETVPICEVEFPTKLFGPKTQPKELVMEDTLCVGLGALPVPDDTCAWEDILNFRATMKGKASEFRQFLSDLATKEQTEDEIQKKIKWHLEQYRDSMKTHHVKSSLTAIEVLIPVIEVVVDPSKWWLALLKIAVSMRKRRVELLEAEMRTPGKECAYVFKAQQQFRTQKQECEASVYATGSFLADLSLYAGLNAGRK